MTSGNTIFRQEALEFQARGRTSTGTVLRLGRPWLRVLSWLTAALVLAGLVALWTVRTAERATGPALVSRDGSVVAVLPLAVAPQLPQARGLTVRLPHGKPLQVTVRRAQPADGTTIARAGLASRDDSGILLHGTLASMSAASRLPGTHVHGRAVVVLRSERLVDVLSRQFREMLGDRGAQ
jgi:hypothetical protein